MGDEDKGPVSPPTTNLPPPPGPPARARVAGKLGWRDRLEGNNAWNELSSGLDIAWHQDGLEAEDVQGDLGNRLYHLIRTVVETYGFRVEGAGYPTLWVRVTEKE